MTQATPTLAAAGALRALLADRRVVAVVRATEIPDPAGLCEALMAGGIGVVELTFSTPGVEAHLARAAAHPAVADGRLVVGAGTVLDADQARAAIDAGAAFLVTPGVGRATEEVARVAAEAGVPTILGAFTPSEVMVALELGSEVVKVFPASLGGPRLIKDLRGPFPDVPLVPSGGVTAANAQEFLDAGALAVCAGTGVVPPDAVARADWAVIEAGAREFCAGLETSTVPVPSIGSAAGTTPPK